MTLTAVLRVSFEVTPDLEPVLREREPKVQVRRVELSILDRHGRRRRVSARLMGYTTETTRLDL